LIKYKQIPEKDLREMFKRVKFPTEPTKQQLSCILFALKETDGRVVIANGVGSGKTLTSLYIAKFLGAKKILVLCKDKAVSGVWVKQVKQHVGADVIPIKGTRKKRRSLLEQDSWIYAINYEGMQSLYTRIISPGVSEIDPELFIHDFDCLIVDELHHFRHFEATKTQIAYQLSRRAKYVIGLTGTLMNIDYVDLWSQYLVVDLGRTFGNDFYKFLFKFYEVDLFMNATPKDGAEEFLAKRAAMITIRYESEECTELPPKKNIDVVVEYTQDQKMFNELILSGEPFVHEGIQFGKVRRINMKDKLQQICSGFLYTKDELSPVVYFSTNKYNKCVELCKKINQKVVIFYKYVEERELLIKSLTSAGFSVIVYTSEDDRLKFTDDPSIDCFLVSIYSGQDSIDLTVASVMIIFSTDTTAITRVQQEGRIWRKGKNEPCLIIDLITKNGADDICRTMGLSRVETMERFQSIISDHHDG
jgi:superfamily II DNA or RNA helicase